MSWKYFPQSLALAVFLLSSPSSASTTLSCKFSSPVLRDEAVAAIRSVIATTWSKVDFRDPPPAPPPAPLLVNLTLSDTAAEPLSAESGEATTAVSVLSDESAVIVYELADLTVYDEESIEASALEGTNLTTADVEITVNASFTISGVIIVPSNYSAEELKEDIAADLGLSADEVQVQENPSGGSGARRKLLQTGDTAYSVTILTTNFSTGLTTKDALTKPTELLGTVVKRANGQLATGGEPPKIVAKIKTIFQSIVEKTIGQIFEEKLSSVSVNELNKRVNAKLKAAGLWKPIPTYNNTGSTLLDFNTGEGSSNRYLPSGKTDPPLTTQNTYLFNFYPGTTTSLFSAYGGTVNDQIVVQDADGISNRGYALDWDLTFAEANKDSVETLTLRYFYMSFIKITRAAGGDPEYYGRTTADSKPSSWRSCASSQAFNCGGAGSIIAGAPQVFHGDRLGFVSYTDAFKDGSTRYIPMRVGGGEDAKRILLGITFPSLTPPPAPPPPASLSFNNSGSTLLDFTTGEGSSNRYLPSGKTDPPLTTQNTYLFNFYPGTTTSLFSAYGGTVNDQIVVQDADGISNRGYALDWDLTFAEANKDSVETLTLRYFYMSFIKITRAAGGDPEYYGRTTADSKPSSWRSCASSQAFNCGGAGSIIAGAPQVFHGDRLGFVSYTDAFKDGSTRYIPMRVGGGEDAKRILLGITFPSLTPPPAPPPPPVAGSLGPLIDYWPSYQNLLTEATANGGLSEGQVAMLYGMTGNFTATGDFEYGMMSAYTFNISAEKNSYTPLIPVETYDSFIGTPTTLTVYVRTEGESDYASVYNFTLESPAWAPNSPFPNTGKLRSVFMKLETSQTKLNSTFYVNFQSSTSSLDNNVFSLPLFG